MDADTRHQLKQNELAEALQKFREKPQDRFWVILSIIILMVAIYLGVRYFTSQAEAAREDAWMDMLQIRVFDEGGEVASLDPLRAAVRDVQQPGLQAAARLRLTNALMAKAASMPTEAQSLYEEARDNLLQLVDNRAVASEWRAAARYALATVYESLNNWDAAREQYEALTAEEEFVGSPFQSMAAARLDDFGATQVPVTLVPGSKPPPPTPATGPSGGSLLDLSGQIPERPTQTPPPAEAPADDVDAADGEADGSAASTAGGGADGG